MSHLSCLRLQECVVDVCQQGPRMAEQAEIVEDEAGG